jgi:hypothetical protein
MSDFAGFYKRLGFDEYPFASFAAENEKNSADLFIRPGHYGPAFEIFANGASMFLVGERGVGKTALTYDFLRSAERDNAFGLIVDNFSSIEKTYPPAKLYRLIAQMMAVHLFELIFKKGLGLSRFDRRERLFLAYLHNQFIETTTRTEQDEILRGIQLPRWKQHFAWIWRIFLKTPANVAATAGVNLISQMINESLGNPPPATRDGEIRKVFPDLPFEKTDNRFLSIPTNLTLLERINTLCRKLGKTRCVIIIDKLDEDNRLQTDVEAVAAFLQPLVTDNNLMLSPHLQVIVCLWAVPFRILDQQGIRAQKINTERLWWGHEDLIAALNTRLSVYSGGKVGEYGMLFEATVPDGAKAQIIDIANGNPRDLWHIMDKILRQQFRIAPLANTIGQQALEMGLGDFVRSFRYFENYRCKKRKGVKREDIYTYLRDLLTLDRNTFTQQELMKSAKLSATRANEHISEMENIGLIECVRRQEKGTIYQIRDPKVTYAVEQKVEPVRTI